MSIFPKIPSLSMYAFRIEKSKAHMNTHCVFKAGRVLSFSYEMHWKQGFCHEKNSKILSM